MAYRFIGRLQIESKRGSAQNEMLFARQNIQEIYGLKTTDLRQKPTERDIRTLASADVSDEQTRNGQDINLS